jgi:hypothetical protein
MTVAGAKKSEPVIVTLYPPSVEPALGEMLVTAGMPAADIGVMRKVMRSRRARVMQILW